MAFSQDVINEAFYRAGRRCECSLKNCSHQARCNKMLDPNNEARGIEWQAHHIISQKAGGSDSLSNCQILCVKCHENTGSYGG